MSGNWPTVRARGGPPQPENPCKQAKLRASARLDRTQEVAGSSPASSTSKTLVVMRVLTRRVGSRRPRAGDSLARSLARSPRSSAPPAHQKPHCQAVRRYDQLSSGDEIELHLGARGFEVSRGRPPGGRLRFSPEGDAREGCAARCLSSSQQYRGRRAGCSRLWKAATSDGSVRGLSGTVVKASSCDSCVRLDAPRRGPRRRTGRI
jgi:hypothetical protein